jgi:uncharacterized membrane-anchored protein
MSAPSSPPVDRVASKVPQVTLAFWLIKLLATTVGETGGDALSMTLDLGYAVASLIYVAFFALTLAVQVRAKRFHPAVYWAVVVATTTVGTTLSDFLDRSVGLGYVKSSLALLCGVLLVLGVWKRVAGRVAFEDITSRTDEIFYWLTILVSNTLGTALGDFVADTTGLGFERGTLVFGGLLVLVAALYRWAKRISPGVLFWSAYVLTRPFGATLGDTLTKPRAEGGLELGRIAASLSIAALMVAGIAVSTRIERRRARPAASA